MARRKKEESYVPDPTPDRQLEHPSGWCMTNYHDNCPYQFTFGKCGCKCHKEKNEQV